MHVERRKGLVIKGDTKGTSNVIDLDMSSGYMMCSLSDNSLSCTYITVMYSFLCVKIQKYFST